MKQLNIKVCGTKVPAKVSVSSYQNNKNLAILCNYQYDGYEESLVLSTNIIDLPPNMACLDENNLRTYGMWEDITEFIRENNLAEMRGYVPSGYCEYPLYEFNLARLGEVCS